MENLYLQGNSFDRDIPDIRGLVGVQRVGFSNNSLSGSIPEYLANFSSLEYLNLPINNFEGRVPTEGKSIFLVFGNKNLCGGVRGLKLKPCLGQASLLKKVVIGVSLSIAFVLLLLIASISLCWLRKRKKNQHVNDQTLSTLEIFHEKISYGDLRNATYGFSSRNLIGSGSFGTVFKASFPGENNVVAVKVLNLKKHGAMKSC
ncbi:putative LRR receptor-like serine/threonine-protein kinase [Cardamine amara subsp. amara]|uniref:LRR receptor-like serine/threonine-protein kinase n=1 Tax=Cardamine amara subsp. amara TaxID=228776 RepID=A0ABD1ABC0_CARAN